MAHSSRPGLQLLLDEIVSLTRLLDRNQPDRFGAARRTILQTLANNGPVSVPHLARLVRTSRQNIQMIIDRLDHQGWVEEVENPAHKRSSLRRLTPEGAEALASAKRGDSQKFAGLDLSEPQIEAALEALNRISRHLGVAARPEATRRGHIAVARRAPAVSPATSPIRPEVIIFEADDQELPYNLL